MASYQPIGNYSSIELLNILSGRVYTQYTSQVLLNLQMANTFKLGGAQIFTSNITSANDTY